MSLLRYHNTVTWVDRAVTLLAFSISLGWACFFSYLQMPILTAIIMFFAMGGALAHEDSKGFTVASFGLWLLVAFSLMGFSPLTMVELALVGVAG